MDARRKHTAYICGVVSVANGHQQSQIHLKKYTSQCSNKNAVTKSILNDLPVQSTWNIRYLQ